MWSLASCIEREGVPNGMPSDHADREMWRWLLSFATPHWHRFALVLTLSLFVSMVGLAQPYMTKILIDDGILVGRFDIVAWSVAALALFSMVTAVLGGVNRYIYVSVSYKMLHGMRETMFAHLMTLSPDFYARTRQGDIHARLEGDIGELKRFVVDSLLSAVNNGFIPPHSRGC